MLINNNHNNIHFGYDKKLNKELKDKLKTYPDKQWADTLSRLNLQCNKIEDEIILREKSLYTSTNTADDKKLNLSKSENSAKNISPEMKDFIDIFTLMKETLVGYVSATFDDLNYADREAHHYEKSYLKHKNTDTYRFNILEKLSGWMNNPEELQYLIDDNKKNNEEKKDEIQNTSSSKLIFNKYDIDDEEEEDVVSDTSDININSDNPLANIKNKIQKNSVLEVFKIDDSSPKGFSDVAGMDELKKTLLDNVVMPINNPEQAQADFEDYGKEIPKAILLYGPPGCGKTYITQALASEIDGPLYMLNIANIGSHYMNLTSKNLNNAINEAIEESEKAGKTTLLFIDEIDSMGYNRNSQLMADEIKQVTSLLQGLDKAAKSKVMIISATNKYDLLDPALRRRFDHKILVDVPDEQARKALIVHTLKPLKKAANILSNSNQINQITKLLNGYSNKSVCSITKQAALNALERSRADIEIQDFEAAVEKTTEDKIDRTLYLSSSKKEKDKKIGF